LLVVLVAVQELTQTETAAVVVLAVCDAQFRQLVAGLFAISL
jgi:hypothetical protein